MSAARIIVFAKAPQPGLAKTRLAPVLGEEGAARLARQMLDHTVAQACGAGLGAVELCVTPGPDDPVWSGPRVELSGLWPAIEWSDQGAGDLGERMARAAQRGLGLGQPVLLIGTDCPMLDAARLRVAAASLSDQDLAINRVRDGGYVLLGLRQFAPELFADMAWGTSAVAAETLRRARALGWRIADLDVLVDIDEPADLDVLPPDWR